MWIGCNIDQLITTDSIHWPVVFLSFPVDFSGLFIQQRSEFDSITHFCCAHGFKTNVVEHQSTAVHTYRVKAFLCGLPRRSSFVVYLEDFPVWFTSKTFLCGLP